MHTHQPSFEDTLERLKLARYSQSIPMSKHMTSKAPLPKEILLGFDAEDCPVQSFPYENSFSSQMLKPFCAKKSA